MLETPTAPPTHKTDNSNVWRFLAGATPTAAAIVAVLWQLLDPYVAPNHYWVLGTIAAACVCTTLADWVWCAIRDIRERLIAKEEREIARLEAVVQQLEKIDLTVVKLDRCTQGVHQKLDHQKSLIGGLEEELRHLRALIISPDLPSVASQQLGPRRIN